MTSSFTRAHATLLLRYAGISFISGAVNHGFFSGARSVATALAGMALFAGAFWLEHRDGPRQHAWRQLGWSALLSVGLGFFTGGLQHFPDSPERSAWVVPLGFALSVLAFVSLEFPGWTSAVRRYAVVGLVLVAAASLGTQQLLRANPQWLGGHAHGDEAAHGDTPGVAMAQVVGRTVEVAMSDAMRFSPARLQASPGETVRLAVTNTGQLPHELVIGTASQLREHAQAMRSGQPHAHGGGAALMLQPGQRGELVVTFRDAGELAFACLVPGHFEAGMRGDIVVAAAAASTAGAETPEAMPKPAQPAGDGHANHKH